MPRGEKKTEAEREAERVAKEAAKQRKAEEKEAEKQRKAAEREAVKASNVAAREAEKQRKLAEKKAEKANRAKERERQRNIQQAKKQAEKEEQKKQREKDSEPKIKWKKSKAKQLLYQDIRDGRVPLNSKDENGKSTMNLRVIYDMRPEYSEYHYDKFSSRVSSLRKTIKDCNNRAELDQEAFDNYKTNHPNISFYSHKGYIQWQGSEAQVKAQKDISTGEHVKLGMEGLWAARPAYYTNFPLEVWRDKIRQEIRTAKYLHTLEVKGRDMRKKKLVDVKDDQAKKK